MDSGVNKVIENVRQALGRGAGTPVPPRPAAVPARQPGSLEDEIDLLIKEIDQLSGMAQRMEAGELPGALGALVQSHEVKKAVLWDTPWLKASRVEEQLRAMGVEIVPPGAEMGTLAACDLGVTEVDYALPETGSLGLLSGPDKPRTVSLLPRVFLALVHPTALRADLHQVFAEARQHNYLILITGPSRTADIELTVTLGVHGPRWLVVWIMV
jgi:L-lactate dehydrogenase complex protein LldG